MKRTISIVLAFVMVSAAVYPCQSLISARINRNSIRTFSDSVNELIDTYDCDEEYVTEKDSSQRFIRDRLIVSSDKITDDCGAVDKVVGLGYTVLQFEDGEAADAAREKLIADGCGAEYDAVLSCNDVTSTPSTSEKWGNERVESEETLNAIKASGMELSEVTVGVLDTGVDYTHPDLSDRIVESNVNFSSSGKENDSSDDQGHGTMVSGIIAQNTTDNVKIKPYKVLSSDGNCATSQVISAVSYILSEKDMPDVVNMSFGGEVDDANPYESTQTDLIQRLVSAGITVVVSAGNDSADTANYSPANISSVITVSACDASNKMSSYSNYGTVVDIAAPGDNIYTTNLGGGYTNEYSGTSFSAPFVAAAAATVLMLDDTLSPSDVESRIKDAAFPIVNNTSGVEWCGAGILNFSALYEDNLAPEPVFSRESGAYNEVIELTALAPDGYIIKYTTDNSIPSLTNGEAYTEAITIEDSMSFVAVAINENGKSRYIPLNYSVIYLADESDFTITDAGAITGYTGTKKSISVPETINGIVPKAVSSGAFNGADIKVVELPDSVTKLNQNAFNQCSYLTDIMAHGVTDVGNFAFYYCVSLTDVDMPNVTVVRRSGFEGCKKLESVNFNETVEEFYGSVFKDTGFKYAYFPKVYNFDTTFAGTPLVTADLPLMYWGTNTFENCYSLEHLYAPELEELGENVFKNCTELTEFVKDGEYDLTNITYIDGAAFSYSYFEEIYLPNVTVWEGSSYFMGCKAVYIDVPTLEKLPMQCFMYCNNLEHVNLVNVTDTVRMPYEHIFADCFSLQELYLPNSLTLPDVYSLEEENRDKMQIKYIYAPKAVYTNWEGDNGLGYLKNIEWCYAPNVLYIGYLPWHSNFTLFLSDKTEYLDTIIYQGYSGTLSTIVAPSGSYAEQWVKDFNSSFSSSSQEYNFVDVNDVECLGLDGDGNMVYRAGDNVCRIPFEYIMNDWDESTINKSRIEAPLTMLFDFNNDLIINAKDYAQLLKLREEWKGA